MKFGVREICDVVFKTTVANQTVGNVTHALAGAPALYIDTAKTSSLEQAATTVYATGGKGNTRLLAWEGEKTMTFTVEDAMLSPLGLAVLTGAGLTTASEASPKYVHKSVEVLATGANTVAIMNTDLGLSTGEAAYLYWATSDPAVNFYATKVDLAGAIDGTPVSLAPPTTAGADNVNIKIGNTPGLTMTFTGATWTLGDRILVDLYLRRAASDVTEITIAAEDFGGYYYVEATTLFRDEANGTDMPAELIIPKAKVQSNFTFSMAATGDPSTFSFVMDAFPAPTKFSADKVLAAIQILGDYEYGS